MQASTLSVKTAYRPTVRLSTVFEGLSNALDMTEGHPRGHATRSALIGLRLGRALKFSPRDQTDLLYALLLKDAGCSANAALVCDLFGGQSDQEVKRAVWMRDWRKVPEQIRYAFQYIEKGGSLMARLRRFGHFAVRHAHGDNTQVFAVRCERGANIARMIGLPERVAEAIRAMDEHWDGGGYPYGHKRDRTPLLARVIGLAQVAEIFWSEGGPEAAIAVARDRRGRWFEPTLVDAFVHAAAHDGFWAGLEDARLERDLLTLVPADLELALDATVLDRIADAFALIIDAKSPFTADHSRRVSQYASAINERLGTVVDPVRLRRAGLLHDIGKLSVPNRILDKPGRLDLDERQTIQQHTTHTLSLLEHVPIFFEFADDAANHHEWIDGHGYSRGLAGDQLTPTARILAVADVLDAVTSDRPYQARMPVEKVQSLFTRESGTHFDEACVDACLGGVLEHAMTQAPETAQARVAVA